MLHFLLILYFLFTQNAHKRTQSELCTLTCYTQKSLRIWSRNLHYINFAIYRPYSKYGVFFYISIYCFQKLHFFRPENISSCDELTLKLRMKVTIPEWNAFPLFQKEL
jgi:hypothetical protein